MLQVVTAPVIGKVAQTGVERMVGTIAGGWMGYVAHLSPPQVTQVACMIIAYILVCQDLNYFQACSRVKACYRATSRQML